MKRAFCFFLFSLLMAQSSFAVQIPSLFGKWELISDSPSLDSLHYPLPTHFYYFFDQNQDYSLNVKDGNGNTLHQLEAGKWFQQGDSLVLCQRAFPATHTSRSLSDWEMLAFFLKGNDTTLHLFSKNGSEEFVLQRRNSFGWLTDKQRALVNTFFGGLQLDTFHTSLPIGSIPIYSNRKSVTYLASENLLIYYDSTQVALFNIPKLSTRDSLIVSKYSLPSFQKKYRPGLIWLSTEITHDSLRFDSCTQVMTLLQIKVSYTFYGKNAGKRARSCYHTFFDSLSISGIASHLMNYETSLVSIDGKTVRTKKCLAAGFISRKFFTGEKLELVCEPDIFNRKPNDYTVYVTWAILDHTCIFRKND